MKRYKRLYLLLGVLAVACIATFGVLRFEEHQEQIKNSDEIILKVPSDTVTSLSWEYQEESLSFHKEEVWLYDEDEAFPVSEESHTDGCHEKHRFKPARGGEQQNQEYQWKRNGHNHL